MTTAPEKAYEELIKRCQETKVLGGCHALLSWDERTYLPPGGGEGRSEQVALISGIIHEKFTSPRIAELLSIIEDSNLVAQSDSDTAVNVREIRRDYDKAVKLPKDLVEELARVTSLAQRIWSEARKNSDFSLFLPKLKEVIELKFRQADAYGYEKEPYDALIDDYEPNTTSDEISEVFGKLRNDLVPLVKAIGESSRHPDMSIIENDFPVDLQEKFGREVSTAVGFDYQRGRIDVSTHPFTTTIGPGDVRITTRYDPRHLGEALSGTLHEAGHGVYEQGLPKEHFGTPLASFVSLGIHESQSRMWENLIGRSLPFWRYFYPKAQKTFPSLKNAKLHDFFFAINKVEPSFIRVEADEVTYNLHILIRFEIERDLFARKIEAKDLPAIWNEKFKDYFGIVPPNDAEGCLQDIHWSIGYFGYFPTYALGNLYASQFYAKAREEIPDIEANIVSGDFSKLNSWLHKNIHSQGRRYHAGELVERVTGQPLGHEAMMAYLKSKFGALYGV